MKDLFLALWRYRHFVSSSIGNELRARFERSRFGAAWMILQPLAQAAIFALVLSRVLAARLPGVDSRIAYPVYLMAGMAAWSLFAEILTRCLVIFVESAGLLKKIVFPRICLPVIVVGTALVNNALLLLATLVVCVAIGQPLFVTLLWLPLLIAVTVAFALGLGLFLGVLNVFLRDIAQVMTVVLQLWFWLTPVVYLSSIVPPRFQQLMELNPMYPVVTAYQDVVLFGKRPSLHMLGAVLAVSCVLLVLALVTFRRAAPEMVDAL